MKYILIQYFYFQEAEDSRNLNLYGFCIDKVINYAWPAFLYHQELNEEKNLQVKSILIGIKDELIDKIDTCYRNRVGIKARLLNQWIL